MAKRYVLDALVRVLGEFIDISEENLNLSLAVWSGSIVLSNLKLKTGNLLKSFNLNIHQGLIRQLEITIPWTALFNTPVKIVIDGVYLQVGPLNHVLSNTEKRKLSLERKREKLRLSDKLLDFSSESDRNGNKSEKTETYIQSLSTKIIDNLEITLKHVHIRYEDNVSIPGRIISAGVTLSTFILATCDENWKAAFIARSSSQLHGMLYKIAEVKGAAVYWNSNSETYGGLHFDDWVTAMNRTIAVENMPSAVRGLKYILAPKNSITIKMAHSENYSESKPKVHVQFDCTNLPIIVDMVQYLQFKKVLSRVMSNNQTTNKYSFRPNVRPIARKDAARAWWKYACKLIIRRPRYIHLIRTIKLNERYGTSSSSNVANFERVLSPSELLELDYLEERIPSHVLVLFRIAAFKEAAEIRRNLSPPVAPISTRNADQKHSSWFGWESSSQNIDIGKISIEDEIPLNIILDEFQEDKILGSNEFKESSSNLLLALLQLSSSATFELHYEGKPVIRSAMSVSANAKIMSVGIESQIDLLDFLVEDKYTPTPPLRNLVSVKHKGRTRKVDESSEHNSRPSSLTVTYSYNRGKSIAKVTALPFIFSLNKECVSMLLAMYYLNSASNVQSSQENLETYHDNSNDSIDTENHKSKPSILKPQHSDFEVIFEAHAPKIIIPEHSSTDSGYLLLDTGYLEVRGFTGKAGMMWAVLLRDINVAMPLSVKDLYSFDEKNLYLIKPFDFGVKVQTIDRSTADMVVNIDIQPELRGELDPKKLARLFHIIQAVYITFQDQPTLNSGVDNSLRANESSVSVARSDAENDDEMEDDGLIYGTPRASPVEFLESVSDALTSANLVKTIKEESTPSDIKQSKSFEAQSKASDISTRTENLLRPIELEPTHVKMRIACNLPRVVIDLTYDSFLKNHLVLILTNMSVVVVTRPYDMVVSLNVNELAIEDSLRSEHQRFLARTPKDCQLINIIYTNSYLSLSPYYKNHASEVIVNFASLGLNCDVTTISHLKPFIEVLLHLRSGNQIILRTAQKSEESVKINTHSTITDTISAAISNVQKQVNAMQSSNFINSSQGFVPTGMLILASIDQVSLDVLRPSMSNIAGEELSNAYSLQVSNMRVVIDMKEFLSSDVKLKSFIIFDSRDSSKDYAYRTIFCPIFENNSNEKNKISNDSGLLNQLPPRAVDLLHVIYKQESTSSAFMDVKISNTTSFVAVDTMLDLSFVLMANFFGVLDLLSNPGQTKITELFCTYLSHYKSELYPQNVDSLKITQSNNTKPLFMSDSSFQESPDASSYATNVTVHIENPRLIVLDDPSSEESQALVGHCEIELHFTRETITRQSLTEIKDLHESLHLTVKKMEMFVVESILNMEVYKPIIDPFGLEYHLRRRIRNGKTMAIHMSTDIDGVDARISINDILLIQSIISRRLLNNNDNTSENGNQAKSNQPDLNKNDEPSVSASKNNFSVSITAGCISLYAIDDHDGKNVPFLHSRLDSISFFAEGNLPTNVKGEGSLVCQTDVYNTDLDAWEPVLERWKPIINASIINGNSTLELKCAHTLQMTLSGFVLHKLYETYLLFLNRGKIKPSANVLESDSNVDIHNQLGDGIDVEIIDSKSGRQVLYLYGSKERADGVITKQTEYDDKKLSQESSINPSRLPASVALHFHGELEGKRKPIPHLPFNIHKPRLCNLLPVDLGSHTELFGNQSKSRRAIMLEPIVEDAYECSRYEPILGIWRKPFLFGDPEEWTDATMINPRSRESIVLKENLWEWQGDWVVDMSGNVGVDIDEEGWEYSNSFKSFSIASEKRPKMPMDCVRRRRWIRTRVPKSSLDTNTVRPLNIFWDVRVDGSGAREVLIRSALLVKNSMPFPIELSLHHNSWADQEVIVGPIKPDEIYSVPLLRSFATLMNARPVSETIQMYKWSTPVACNIQQFDFSITNGINCEPELSGNTNSLPDIVMRASSKQANKCLTIEFQPYLIITNAIPCDIKYRLSSSEKRKESGVLVCGATGKLMHVDTFQVPSLSLKLGSYSWSHNYKIELIENKVNQFTVEMAKKPSSNRSRQTAKGPVEEEISTLAISVIVKLSEKCRYELILFSQSAIVDRTGLDLSIWCNVNATAASTVKTYISDQLNEERVISYSSDMKGSTHFEDDSPAVTRTESENNLADYGKTAGDFGDNFLKMYRSTWGMAASTGPQENGKVMYDFEPGSDCPYIKDVIVKSNHNYVVCYVKDIGSCVYSDRKIRWTHLPSSIRRSNSICIRTSSEDSMLRLKDLIKFRLVVPSIVLIFIDRIMSKPKWLDDHCFEKLLDHGVARAIEGGKLQEIYYSVYAKHFDLSNTGEETISLHGNWNKERGKMYSVFIIPDPRHYSNKPSPDDNMKLYSGYTSEQLRELDFNKMLEQINFNSRYDRVMAGRSWTDGGHGIGLFHTYNDVVSIGVLRGKEWSGGINIGSSTPPRGYVEIVDWSSNKEYQLFYKLERMPGAFHHTQLFTVMPRYCIVNCMDESLMIAQRGATNAQKSFVIKPYHVEAWHKTDSALGNILHFRTGSTAWSLGAIDINEVGSSVVLLPKRSTAQRPKFGDFSKKEPFVIHVEVKEADQSENCSVVIVIWRASVHGQNAALSIQNESDVTVTVAQSEVYYDVEGYDSSLFEVVVSPKQWVPFGWADPDALPNIQIVVGDSLSGQNVRRIATLSLLKTGELLRLPDQSGRLGISGEVLLSVITRGSGRVLKVTRMNASSICKSDEDSSNRGSSVTKYPTFDMKLNLSSYGMSLVLDKPVRREFLSLYIDGLNASLKKTGPLRSFELNITDLQIDNYSDTKVHPVLLRSKKKEIHRSITTNGESDVSIFDGTLYSSQPVEQVPVEIPLIELSIIQESTPDSGSTPFYPYLGLRILPVYLEVDSTTIQILLIDLINDFKTLSASQILAHKNPTAWIEDFNKNLLSPKERYQLLDLYQSQLVSQRSKMYFQKLIVHPIKLFITIVPNPDYAHQMDQETIQSTFSNVFKSFAAVDRVQLKLRSFEVEDAMETKTSLLYLILTQFRHDINSHFGQLFGSLAVIGSPMGFARKVGRGVKAFFYEPYQGLVQSPQDFVLGIGKGTTSLVSGVVSGAMNSTVAIVGTAAKGISYLSGDSEYIRKRAIKREMHRANRRGVLEGLFDGGESLISGLASGVTGLVTRPLEEARRGGAMGFVRGIGLGLVGAAVKPVMGFTDGIASVANGISNSVGDNAECDHVRPARAFERSASDSSDLIIRPLHLEAAFAQEFVLSRGKLNNYQDSFLTYIPMDEHGSAVILSEVYIYWRKPKSLWGRTWSNISHMIFFPTEVGIMMYPSVGKNKPEAFSIVCSTRAKAIEVYTALAKNSHRMGNPSLVIPVDLLDQYDHTKENNKTVDLRNISRPGHSTNLAGEIDGYRFGEANNSNLTRIIGPELDVLRRCEHFLSQSYQSLKELDERIWRLVWEWECTHTGLTASRCCVTLILNRSDTPIQLGKVQIVHGRNVLIMGSEHTGYEEVSKCIQPNGSVVVFIWAFSPTPIEIGHVKAIINTAEFVVTVASTQRESSCISQGGLSAGFLEKSVAEWWSKYVVLIEN